MLARLVHVLLLLCVAVALRMPIPPLVGMVKRSSCGASNIGVGPVQRVRNEDATRLQLDATGLEEVGEEIVVLPAPAGVKKIVMKFGGSSLASPDRITYVSKYAAFPFKL